MIEQYRRSNYMYKPIIAIISIFTGCINHPIVQQQISLKDSTVKNYLRMVDSSSIFHDTLDYNYKILKAYVNNDSNFFLNMKKSNEQLGVNKFRPDTCVHIRKLVDLQVDEAFRFKHSQSFCDYRQIITISRLKDSIWFDYLEFKNGPGEPFERSDGIEIVSICKVTETSHKQIGRTEWNSLKAKIYAAEYYGMKPYYNNLTTDGSWWQLEAYQKEASYLPTYYSVYRHSPANSKFWEIGFYMMTLTGAKKKCSEYF